MNEILSPTKCAGGEPAGDRGCDDELQSMTSKEACEAIQEKKKGIWDAVESIGGALVNPIGTIVSAFSSDAEVSTNIQTLLNINIDTKTIINQMASCDNVINQIQTNVIRGPGPECLAAWAAMGLTAEEIKQGSKATNITQENIADAKLDCQANQIIDALSKMDASIDNLAMQEAIAEAQGLMSDSKVDQNVCNNINVNMSACKYISQNQCCSQVIQQRQENLIDKQCALGEWSNITQKNEAKALATCRMNADSSISDTTSGDITNKISQSGEAKATGLTSSFMAMIVALIVFVIIASIAVKLIMMKKSKKMVRGEISHSLKEQGGAPHIFKGTTDYYLLLILGCLIIVGGLICITLFFTTKKNDVEIIDKPFSLCEQTRIVENPERGTFKRIKEKALKDSAIIGVDFFPDDIESNPAELRDNQLGLGVYLSYIDKDDEECDPIDTTKERSISIMQTNNNFIVLGIILIVGGIILIFVDLIYLRSRVKIPN